MSIDGIGGVRGSEPIPGSAFPVRGPLTSSTSKVSTDTYFDLGSFQSWNFVDYSKTPPVLNQKSLDNYLNSFINQLKNAGLSQISLSFAQVGNLSKILNGDFKDCTHDDAFYLLDFNTQGATISSGGEQKTILQYMIDKLADGGIGACLSFGGQNGTFDFGFDSRSPSEVAQNMIKLIKTYHLKGVDFDIEDNGFVSRNGAKNLAQFFYALHQGAGIPITFTVPGDATQWGPSGQIMGPLFAQGYGFIQMFDGLNLMLYNGQCYLDAGTEQSWDLELWIKQLMEQTHLTASECAAFMHIGFTDALDYTNPSTSAGTKYHFPPNVKTSGQAAAYILMQLLTKLRADYNDPSLNFGASFFWPGKADYSVDQSGDCSFFKNDPFEYDFTHFLEEHYGKR